MKKIKKSLLLFFCAFTLGGLIKNVYSSTMGVKADSSTSVLDGDIHNETLAKEVKYSNAEITILTHGLGGTASDWSNNTKGVGDHFVENNSSLIEKIKDCFKQKVNLYRVSNKVEKNSSNTLPQYKVYNEGYTTSVITSGHIASFSQHTIIVVEYDSWCSMKEAYIEFDYIVDKISKDYLTFKKSDKTSDLPRLNLIGHSMGGLINMQYAIEHPKNVSNLISIGTPYNGSWYDNSLTTFLGYNDFEKQRCINGKCNHDYYFCNIEKRKEKWNQIYSENKHINFLACSAETSMDLIYHIINSDDFESKFGSNLQVAANVAGIFSGMLSGDICVDLSSQKADGYNGVANFNKAFEVANSNFDNLAQNEFPVPHNLEPWDHDILGAIIRALRLENSSYKGEYGITVSFVGESIYEDRIFHPNDYVVKLTNDTGIPRKFDYNKKLCFSTDSDDWMDIGDIVRTEILNPGESRLLEVEENYLARRLVISYSDQITQKRYAFDGEIWSNRTSFADRTFHVLNSPFYEKEGIEVSIVSKFAFAWLFQVKNVTDRTLLISYNANLAFENDACNWNNLRSIKEIKLNPGEDTHIVIYENFAAGTISLSYTDNNYRHIFYAYDLDKDDRTMTPFGYVKDERLIVNIIDFDSDNDVWTLELTNNTGAYSTFFYNSKMCFENDAKEWDNLEDICKVSIPNGASKQIEIEENVFAGYIAISYLEDNVRNVFYANDLNNTSKTLDSYITKIDFHSYEQNYMKVGLVGEGQNNYHLLFTNKTGSSRTFHYFSKMCDENNAKGWNHLNNPISSFYLANNSSCYVEIAKNASYDGFAFSYKSGNLRYLFYGEDPTSDCKMSVQGRVSDETVDLKIVKKQNGTYTINLTNNYSSRRTFYYNKKMCFESAGKNWDGLKDVAFVTLDRYVSKQILIKENGTAGYIALCYIAGSTRHIYYGNELDADGGLVLYNTTKTVPIYNKNTIGVSIVGKDGDTWLVNVRNNSASTLNFYYNSKLCFENDAKNWNDLANVSTISNLAGNSTTETPIKIVENGLAGTMVISYLAGTTRHIFYAYNLSTDGSMKAIGSTKDESIKVEILSKSGGTWKFRLTNKTGSSRTFFYNTKLCFEGDAKNWDGLRVIKYLKLSNNSSTEISISQNGTAGTIAISYIQGSTRYIFYAYGLNTDGRISSFRSTTSVRTYTQNQMTVSIAGKRGSTWLVYLTNKTGSYRTFEYNSKLCFEGDAKNWSLDSDVKSISLSNENSTSDPSEISENGMAGTMAISYKSGNIRYVFYAYDLSTSGTMTAKGNSFDITSASSECVTEGTLITLADGTKKPVEELNGSEMLLVWNLETGTYDSAPILFIDKDPQGHYEVIKVTFSDGTIVNIVSEHGFFDIDLNKYVYLDENASDYIGHRFIKNDSNGNYEEVTLTNVKIEIEVTTTYSPVTYSHLCYYVNDMLSMPGGINGLFNYFDVDSTTMMYDSAAKDKDIEMYGLLTYEELYEFAPVSREMFDAVNGQYLKIAVGKGLISLEDIQYLADRYSSFVPEKVEEEANDISLKEYVLNKLESYGYSLEDLINYYLQLYSGCPWIKVPSSVMSDLDWDVVFNGDCYIVSINLNIYGTCLNMQVAIA